MHKKTALDQVEITRNSSIGIRLTLEVVDDDNVTVINKTYHRGLLVQLSSHDVNEQIQNISDHLGEMGWPAIAEDDVTKIVSISQLIWSN